MKPTVHPCLACQGGCGLLTEQSPQSTATTTNEPTYTSHETMKSRMVAEPGAGARCAEPHVEEIAIFVPQILTQVVVSGGVQPQIVERPVPVPQETVQEIMREADRAIVYEDDREEETLQSDAETTKKVTINEASALLSVETTLT